MGELVAPGAVANGLRRGGATAVACRDDRRPPVRGGSGRRQRPLMVMILGPRRRLGVPDDPFWAEAHISEREVAVRLFDLGHVPVTSLDPTLFSGNGFAGRDAAVHLTIGDVIVAMAKRLLARCDAVLRVGGPSSETDQLVQLAMWEGKAVFYCVSDVPAVS